MESKRRADIYVFSHLHATDKATVDPLNLDQWTFYVLAASRLDAYARSQSSITLNSLRGLTKGITYHELNEAIKEHGALNHSQGLPASGTVLP